MPSNSTNYICCCCFQETSLMIYISCRSQPNPFLNRLRVEKTQCGKGPSHLARVLPQSLTKGCQLTRDALLPLTGRLRSFIPLKPFLHGPLPCCHPNHAHRPFWALWGNMGDQTKARCQEPFHPIQSSGAGKSQQQTG